MQNESSSITIKGEEIPVINTRLEVVNLKFFADNPRVYTVVHAGGKAPTQEEIEKKLRKMEHVKQLIHDIKSNDGLIDPMIVKDGTFEVLEGNSRLAAYRALFNLDPIKWGRAKCWVLPVDISEMQIYAILGQYHLKGKKDWAPYEQAGFLYRRHINQNVSIEQLNEEIGLGIGKTKQLVDTYQFMLSHGEDNINRWSYYEEYLKSNIINKARELFPELDTTIVAKIKTGEINRAVDIRDKLRDVAKSVKRNKSTFKKLATGQISLDQAFNETDKKGYTSHSYQKLSRFRTWLISDEVKTDIRSVNGTTKDKILYEIKKIHSLLGKHIQ